MRSALKPWGKIGAVCAALTLAPFPAVQPAAAQEQPEAAPEAAPEKQIQDDGRRGSMFRGGRGRGEPQEQPKEHPQAQPSPVPLIPQSDTNPDQGNRGDRSNRGDRGDRGGRDHDGNTDNGGRERTRDNTLKPDTQPPQGMFTQRPNRWTGSDADDPPRRSPDNTNRRKDEPRRKDDRDNSNRDRDSRDRWNNNNNNWRNDNWRDDNRRNRNDWMRERDRDRDRRYARYRDPNHRWRGSRPRIIIQSFYTLPPAYYDLRPIWAGPLYDEELWASFEPAVYDALPYGAREKHEQAFQFALYGRLHKTQSWWHGDVRGDITMIDEWYFGDEWCRDFIQTITTSTWKRTVDGRMCIDRGEPWRLVLY